MGQADQRGNQEMHVAAGRAESRRQAPRGGVKRLGQPLLIVSPGSPQAASKPMRSADLGHEAYKAH